MFRSRKEPISDEDLARRLGGDADWTGTTVDRQTAMGICIQTGNTASGYNSNSTPTIMAKTDNTIKRRNCIRNWKAYLVPGPIRSPVRSPMVFPLFRAETTMEEKSCTAPMNMDPRNTQMKAGTHPQIIPMAGPTMGPSPAMVVK